MKKGGMYILRWFLCLFVITAGAAAAGMTALAEQSGFSAGFGRFADMAERIPPERLRVISAAQAAEMDQSMQQYVPNDETLIRNRASSYYYYGQLDPMAKEMYDVMLMIAQDPATEGNVGVMMTDMDPDSDEFYYEYLCALYAMTYDHPELFWLYTYETSIGFYSEANSMNGFYLVYFGLTEPYENYEAEMTRFNAAAEAFLAQIDTNVSQYEIAMQVHDKLINTVTYDMDVLADLQNSGTNLAHTAYGVLVENSAGQANTAVCDGYSFAFEYLLQQCGMEAVVVCGYGGTSLDQWDLVGHAWSMVQLGGGWYEVDVTWDDAGTIEDQIDNSWDYAQLLRDALSDTAFRNKIEHIFFLLSTENMYCFEAGDEFVYTDSEGSWIKPLAPVQYHVRLENDGSIDLKNADPTVISLAPVAQYNFR